MTSSMIQRVLTALVGIPLLLLVVRLGSPWLSILVAIVAIQGVREFSDLALQRGARALTPFAMMWVLAFIATGHFIADGPLTEIALLPVFVAGSALSLAWLLLRRPSENTLLDWSYAAGAALYLGWLLSYALLLRGTEQGWQWVFLVLLGTFATDTGALFVGKAVGKRALASKISPGKTWEGAIGGLLAGMGTVLLMSFLMDMEIALWQTIVIGAIVGLFAQMGDLLESYLKRLSGTKDAGTILPGHGGILDRLDSVVLNLVMVYYFGIWIVQ